MGLNFPSAPMVGEVYPNPATPGVPQYMWDGEVWASSLGGVNPALFVQKSGDVMSGDLSISKQAPQLVLDRADTTTNASLVSKVGGIPKWSFSFEDSIRLLFHEETMTTPALIASYSGNPGEVALISPGAFVAYRSADFGGSLSVGNSNSLSKFYNPINIDVSNNDQMPPMGWRGFANLTVKGDAPWLGLINTGSGASGLWSYKGAETDAGRRWALTFDAMQESGANRGSDFHIDRYSDDGALLGRPLRIDRADGHIYANAITTAGDVTVTRSNDTGFLFFGLSGDAYLGYSGTGYALYGGPLYLDTDLTVDGGIRIQTDGDVTLLRDPSQPLHAVTKQYVDAIEMTPGPAGPAGADGLDGAPGAIGPEGPKGDTGDIGPAGADGVAGAQGPQGEVGPQGEPGIDGGNSAVWTSDTPPPDPVDGTLWWDSTTSIMFVYYDDGSSLQWVESGRGNVGEKGEQGPIGPAGPAGADGATGPAGPAPDTSAFVAKSGDTMTGQLVVPSLWAEAPSMSITLTLKNTTSGYAKLIRIGDTGSLDIINNANSAVVASIDDAGGITGSSVTANTALIHGTATVNGPFAVNNVTSFVGNSNVYGSLTMYYGQLFIRPDLPQGNYMCASYINYVGGGNMYGLSMRAQADDCAAIAFNNSVNGVVGTIHQTAGGVTYNTTSDGTLKENLTAFDAGPIIDQIEVWSFTWKATGKQSYGVIAQQVDPVYHEAVTHILPDMAATKDVPTPEWWGVDYSKFVPLLLQEVKALRSRVAQLEAV